MEYQGMNSMERDVQEISNFTDDTGQNNEVISDESPVSINKHNASLQATNVGNYEQETISCETLKFNLIEKPPQVIYESPKKVKHRKQTNVTYYKHATILKKSNTKCKRRVMNKKIHSYVNGKVSNLNKITNPTNAKLLSRIKSPGRMLKQVPGKESLIEDSTKENNENLSLRSTNSIVSNYSQNTITFAIGVESSETDVVDSGSIMFLVDDQINKNVINISRAQVDNISFGNMQSSHAIDSDHALTNAEVMSIPRESTPYSMTLESLGQSSEQGVLFSSSEPSALTLINDDNKSQPFLDNNSYFYQPSSNYLAQSDITLISDMSESNETYPKTSNQILMDTVNDLGMFPEMTARRSVTNFNDVIVAERLITNFNPIIGPKDTANYNHNYDSNSKHIKDIQNTLNPSFELNYVPKDTGNLLDERTLDNIRKFNEKYKTNTCTKEWLNDNPSNIAELWKKLAEALDSKVQKLEKSLTDTILSEMKLSFSILNKFKHLIDAEKSATVIDIKKNVDKLLDKLDEDLQCNILDPIKPTSTEIALSRVFLEETKGVQYNLEPSFEILKPAVKPAEDSQELISIVVDKPKIAEEPEYYRPRRLWPAIWYFLKENSIVLTGAPVFLGALVCIYLIVALIVNSA